MKKLSLILGSLLLAATASAKEVVAAPVVVEEVVVEEPAVVEAPKFKPSGFAQMELRYRGEGEHDESPNSNFLRTEYKGSISMTEADTLQFRVRSYEDLNSSGETNQKSENTESRYRWLHKFGTVGDTKIKLASRLELRENDSYDKVEGQLRYSFVDYIPDFKYLDTTEFLLAPKVLYTEIDGNGTGSDNSTGAGVNFEWYAVTGEWEWDLTVYYTHLENPGDYSMSDAAHGDGTHSNEDLGTASSDQLMVEFYTYWTHKLWNSEDKFYQVNSYLENGVDPWHIDGGHNEGKIQVYVQPEVQLQFNINAATKIVWAAGAYYENKDNDDDRAQDFQWQPMTRVFIKTTF